METRTGFASLSEFSARNLLIVAAIVTGVTGGNLWLHRSDTRLGYASYTGYGFTIEYKQGMEVYDGGFGGGPATDAFGTMQARVQSTYLEQVGVIWVKPESMPAHFDRTPEGAQKYILESAGMGGTQIVGEEEPMTMIKDGHEIVYQITYLADPGGTIPLLIGAWHCEEAGKFLMLYTIYVPDFENLGEVSEDLEPKWREYLDSLVCHS